MRAPFAAFYAVSAVLRTGQPIVHRHGAPWQALGASMSLPVLVSPQMPAGQVLVDGPFAWTRGWLGLKDRG